MYKILNKVKSYLLWRRSANKIEINIFCNNLLQFYIFDIVGITGWWKRFYRRRSPCSQVGWFIDMLSIDARWLLYRHVEHSCPIFIQTIWRICWLWIMPNTSQYQLTDPKGWIASWGRVHNLYPRLLHNWIQRHEKKNGHGLSGPKPTKSRRKWTQFVMLKTNSMPMN